MMKEITKQDVIHGNDVAELSKLHKEFTELAIKFEDKNFENSRLREREKELVEALRHYFFCRNDQDGSAHERSLAVMKAKENLESLLSKYENT